MNGPLSPRSNQGSDWSGVQNYHYSGPPPYSPSLPHNRGNLISPPISGSSHGTQARISNGMNRRPGDPSPPNSIARSSYGTTLSTSEAQRRKTLQMEERLSHHYTILKRFLAQSLRDEKGSSKPNRAKDKLLRLSPVQFQELSTDVFDELLRRQSSSGQQRNGPGQVPDYLLPKENFHPKRNQARQKLATLPPPRFQDLATDVFYELERRFPLFAGRDISRVGSPAASMHGGPPSRVGTPTGRRPSYGPRNASLGSQVMAGLGIPSTEGQNDNYGRPAAKTFQSNTIIPNKSTMVEDDDDEASEAFGSRRDTAYTSRSVGGPDKDRRLAELETQVGDYESKVGELHTRLNELEESVRGKDTELDKLQESHREQKEASDRAKGDWVDLQSDLEGKLTQARNLNSNLQTELDKARNNHATTERDLRSQMDLINAKVNGGGEWKTRYEDLSKKYQDLQSQYLRQEKLTSEVKEEMTGFLNQVKDLSERSDASLEREEHLVYQVHMLEKELQDWKGRYARAKTQTWTTRASSPTILMPQVDLDHESEHRELMGSDGLIEDVHVTKFQIAIDHLLQSARRSELQAILGYVKSVVVAVRQITLDVGQQESSKEEVSQQRQKLITKTSATTNNLITAAKNFVISKGLSPVSLLDAAASHVSAAIVELVRSYKIRPTPLAEVEDDVNGNTIGEYPVDYQSTSRSRANESYNSELLYKNSQQQKNEQSKSSKAAQNGILSSNKYRPAQDPKSTPVDKKGPENKTRELKNFVEYSTDTIKSSIQALISSIRTSAEPPDVLDHLAAITSTTSQIISQTDQEADKKDQALVKLVQTLAESRDRLEDAGREGEEIGNENDWNAFVKELPPLAFAIAKGTNELGGYLGDDEFS